MISAVLRREARLLAVSGSPAAEWPLAGSPCPRAVGLQSVGYARGLLQRRSKVSRQIRPLEWTVTSPVCSGGPGPVQSKTNTRPPQEPCLSGQTLRCPTWWGDVCRTDGIAVTWRRWAGPDKCRELSSLSKHLTSTNNFTLKCCRCTSSWRRDRCLWTSGGVMNGTRHGRHSLQLDL